MSDDGIIFNYTFHIAGVMETVEVIKASVNGSVRDFAAHGCRFFSLAFDFFSGSGILIQKVQMPFSDDRRVVALPLQVTGHGRSVFSNQAGFKSLHDAVLQSGAPAVAPGHDAVTCWSANGRSRVCVGKDHAFGGQAVDARRRDFPSFWIQALHVTVA